MAYQHSTIGIFLFVVLFGVSLLSLTKTATALTDQEIERELLDKLLGYGKYDNKIRASGFRPDSNGLNPNPESNATFVSVNFYVRSIQYIDDVKMEYGVQLTFRQQWQDDRLIYRHLSPHRRLPYITLTESKRIWMPDLFFSNEIGGHLHDIIMPNVYVRIFPDGQVLYSLRITLKLSCPMILKLYPMDKQTCSLRMASYGYTDADIVFQWKKDDPVQVTPELHLPRFALERFTTDYCNSHTNTGIYSCLRVDFLFKREFSYYLRQIYVPCTAAVIIAWLSFWLDAKQVGRGLLVLATWLIMALCTILLNYTLPPVSYTKALDVWTGVCLTFAFAALCQFVVVHYLGKSDNGQGPDPGNDTGNGTGKTDDGGEERLNLWQSFKKTSLSQKIDIISRLVYPVVFILFLVMYWGAYTSKKGERELGSYEGVRTTYPQPGKETRRLIPWDD